MKHLKLVPLILLWVATFVDIDAQIVDIPDTNFLNVLIAKGVDLNGDGAIQVTEAEAVDTLWVFQSGDIESLTGIEAFINMENFQFEFNKVRSLDLSNLTNLNYLNLSSNELDNLTLDGLNQLEYLGCGGNNLISLDLSSLKKLKSMDLDYNQLNTLDISGLKMLEVFEANNNQIDTFITSEHPLLYGFILDNNQLRRLPLNGMPNLEEVYIASNQLTELDVAAFPILNTVSCSDNNLTSLIINNGLRKDYLEFAENPDLQRICVDFFELQVVQEAVDNYGYVSCEVGTYCPYATSDPYRVSGSVYSSPIFSANNKIPNAKLKIEYVGGESFLFADVYGDYSIDVPEGDYQLSYINTYSNFLQAHPEGGVSFTFPGDSSQVIQNFHTDSTDYLDLGIYAVPIDDAQAGFEVNYVIIVENNGKSQPDGIVEITYNQNFADFISAEPAADVVSDGTVTWYFDDVLPFSNMVYRMRLELNRPTDQPPLNDGDIFKLNAKVTPQIDDVNPEDNEFELFQTVVNSFDPNDKMCLQGGRLDPEMAGEFVHYKIRFENTGSANAINIVVKDVIDTTRFDINTLIPLTSSHTFDTRITNNEVEFIFKDIRLPFADSINDGYVNFKIKSWPTLMLGDSLINEAEIYFDFNFPIITEPATSIFALDGSSVNDLVRHFDVSFYPNPVVDRLFVESSADIDAVDIVDMNGRLVKRVMYTQPSSTLSVDVSTLNSGMYQAIIRSNEQSVTKLFQVQSK